MVVKEGEVFLNVFRALTCKFFGKFRTKTPISTLCAPSINFKPLQAFAQE